MALKLLPKSSGEHLKEEQAKGNGIQAPVSKVPMLCGGA